MNKSLEISKKKKRYLDVVNSSLPDRVFWISFLLLLIIHCIENTSVIYADAAWVQRMYIFRNLLYIALLVKIGFLSSYKTKELICGAIFFFVGFASLLGSRDFGLLEFFIVMFAIKDQAPKKLVTVFALIKGSALLITPLLWRLGILSALYYQDDVVGYYNTYGFCHRNVLGANVAVLCLAWFYLRYQILNVLDVILWTIIGLVTYKFSVSRTSVIIIFLIVFGMYFFRKRQKFFMHLPYMRKIIFWGFTGLLLVSIIGTVFYSKDSSVWKFIDSIFTKRFHFSNYCFEEYGLSLFGQNISFVSSMEAQNSDTAKLILDNAFMRAILYYGIIPGALFLWTYFKALDTSFRKRDCALLLSLAVFAVYGMSERYMLDVYYQFPLLIAWNKYYFRKDQKLSEERKTPIEYAGDIVRFCKGIKR